MRRRPGTGTVELDPHSMTHELNAPERARHWRACCASSIEHRFDCTAVPEEQRGAGPFGPVRAPTPAEMIARMRRRG